MFELFSVHDTLFPGNDEDNNSRLYVLNLHEFLPFQRSDAIKSIL